MSTPRKRARASGPRLHDIKDGTLTWSNGRRAVSRVALSAPDGLVLADFSPWQPRPPVMRPGSEDFLRYPSRFGNTLVYRDGRRETLA